MKKPIPIYRIPFDNPVEKIPGPEIIGNKAHNLMRVAGHVPVPPGFVIPVKFCQAYNSTKSKALSRLEETIKEELEHLGHLMSGKKFNSKSSPLLLSVRSGAPISMPGMLETVLNIGLNDDTLRGLIRQTGNPKFAWDCMRRFMQQYGEVVLGVPSLLFEKILNGYLQKYQAVYPEELDIDSLKKLVSEFNTIIKTKTNRSLPYSPYEQLRSAIEAVLRSWNGEKAVSYRQIHSIADDIGTALIVQGMVFGNTGRSSGSGVGFTRNPSNGRREPYIDYLSNAQGEDIVSGRRNADHGGKLAQNLPEVHAKLLNVCSWLEDEFHDMQDFEFTVEEGKLYLLQTRSGKRTGLAALQIAVDLEEEGMINPVRALEMLAGYDPAGFKTVSFSITKNDRSIATATGTGTGVAVGAAVFDMDRIDKYLEKNRKVIFLGRALSTDDIEIINRVHGLVTILGARTSHAVVVSRQLGKVCLVGCDSLRISENLRHCHLGDAKIKEGDMLSIDGESGQIYLGQLEKVISRPEDLLKKMSAWKS